MYKQHLRGAGGGRRDIQKSDVLRAGVVLTHATLEDFLRTIAGWKLPDAEASDLNSIPLAGCDPRNRATKFQLGDLADHRGKTVDELIAESVANTLEYSNYNNSTEVASLLRSVGVDPTVVEDLFTDLDALMIRRHNIVHRADENDKKGSGHHWAKPINTGTVEAWVGTVDEITDRIADSLS